MHLKDSGMIGRAGNDMGQRAPCGIQLPTNVRHECQHPGVNCTAANTHTAARSGGGASCWAWAVHADSEGGPCHSGQLLVLRSKGQREGTVWFAR